MISLCEEISKNRCTKLIFMRKEAFSCPWSEGLHQSAFDVDRSPSEDIIISFAWKDCHSPEYPPSSQRDLQCFLDRVPRFVRRQVLHVLRRTRHDALFPMRRRRTWKTVESLKLCRLTHFTLTVCTVWLAIALHIVLLPSSRAIHTVLAPAIPPPITAGEKFIFFKLL